MYSTFNLRNFLEKKKEIKSKITRFHDILLSKHKSRSFPAFFDFTKYRRKKEAETILYPLFFTKFIAYLYLFDLVKCFHFYSEFGALMSMSGLGTSFPHIEVDSHFHLFIQHIQILLLFEPFFHVIFWSTTF